jgi:hypothetical protein
MLQIYFVNETKIEHQLSFLHEFKHFLPGQFVHSGYTDNTDFVLTSPQLTNYHQYDLGLSWSWSWQTLSQNLVLSYTSPWAGFELTVCVGRRVWRYQRGNQNLYIEEEQTTPWPNEKVQKDDFNITNRTVVQLQCIILVADLHISHDYDS